jgi:WD40 repeat protein
LSVGDAAGDVALWDIAIGDVGQRRSVHNRAVRALTRAGDGVSMAVVSSDGTARLWRFLSGDSLQPLPVGRVWSMAGWRDGLILGGDGGQLMAWDATRCEPSWIGREQRGRVLAVACSADARVVASAAEDGTVALWDGDSGAERGILRHHLGAVNALALSADGRYLAAGGDDMTISIWVVAERSLQRVLRGHSGLVEALAFAPDGPLLASGAQDGTLRLWHAQSWALAEVWSGTAGPIWTVAFAPDGSAVAAGAEDGTVCLHAHEQRV